MNALLRFKPVILFFFCCWLIGCSKSDMSPATTGTGGSMARFTISKDHLYLVNHKNLRVFNITDAEAPEFKGVVELGIGVETIFPYGDYLFIGTQTGMHIFDITSPATPVKTSTYTHVRSCDPVVAQDKYAYVTLRWGTLCNTGVNELQILNVENVSAPSLVTSYSMDNPHGLGIDGDLLFICDGASGLKVYDSSDPYNIELLDHFSGFFAYDVIPYNGLLMVIGKDGLYQFNYEDPENIHQLVRIPF